MPARLVGKRVTVELGADTVTFLSDGVIVAAHERGIHRKTEILDLDHYIEVLWRRPGALPAATALSQARSTGRFRPEHQQFWDLARRKHGDAQGTRALCDVLLLHRHHRSDDVILGIRAALSLGSTDVAVVAVECRRAIEHTTQPTQDVIERVPDLSVYDQLLTLEPNNESRPE